MGVATQNPELRKRFSGKPEYVENFMLFIARELREIMSRLGVRNVIELVGRTDLLKRRENLSESEAKIDLSGILLDMSKETESTFDPKYLYDFKLQDTKDESILLKSKEIKRAIEGEGSAQIDVTLKSTDRTFGTLLGAQITRVYPEGLAEDAITVNCTGSGGQSFGAFIPKGLTLELEGDSNDYFGKGLSGGSLIVRAPKDAKYDPHENIIIGNVALYGATSGKAFIAGMAGERFCIRNSGATAVVEGVGEHGCEYMTGGMVVILGETGKNFAAGMSGGIAYVLDEENKLYKNLNKQFVSMERVEDKSDIVEIKKMIEEHVKRTGSKKGMEILEDFENYSGKFKKIIPTDYRTMLKKIASFEEKGADHKTAQTLAFKAFVGGEL